MKKPAAKKAVVAKKPAAAAAKKPVVAKKKYNKKKKNTKLSIKQTRQLVNNLQIQIDSKNTEEVEKNLSRKHANEDNQESGKKNKKFKSVIFFIYSI